MFTTVLWHKLSTLIKPVCICWKVTYFREVSRQGLSEMWKFKLRPEGREWAMWKAVLRGEKMCKGPGVEKAWGALAYVVSKGWSDWRWSWRQKQRPGLTGLSRCVKGFFWAMGYYLKILTKKKKGHLEKITLALRWVTDSDRRGSVLACWHCYQSSLATDWVAYKKKKKKKLKICCSQFRRLWSPRSGCWCGGLLVGPLFLVPGQFHPAVPFHGGRGWWGLWSLFSKSINLSHEASTPRIKAPPKGSPPITRTFGGSDFSIGIWEGHKHSNHSRYQERRWGEQWGVLQTQVRDDSCLHRIDSENRE